MFELAIVLCQSDAMTKTLAQLSSDLGSYRTTASELVENAWHQFDQSGDQQLFTIELRESSLKEAEVIDAERANGILRSRFAGIPITIKDLFDLQGCVTMAGSRALADAEPSRNTAPCIESLIRAGFIILGKVNMTEFAFSGLGLNPHFGTPANPRFGEEGLLSAASKSAAIASTQRIPGGSSSGSAVSVASGLVAASIGTDTGGSVRIPASFCGVTGYKPETSLVNGAGVIPLSPSLDSVGPLANSVKCCADLTAIMADSLPIELGEVDISQLNILIPDNVVWHVSQQVGDRVLEAVKRLSDSGASCVFRSSPLIDDVLGSGVQGIVAGFESFHWHRDLLASHGDMYDPRVRVRIETGAQISESEYEQALITLQRYRLQQLQEWRDYDAVIWPTTAVTAPGFDELISDTDYDAINQLVLRNTAITNVLDAASISLPLPTSTHASPAGLMLSSPAGEADRLLAVASAIEKIIA